MTKFFLLFLFFIGSFFVAQAQYVDQTPINELDADYVLVWSDSGPLLSSRITVRIDYGQGGRTQQISDNRRRPMTFNGMIAVLNMMSRNGYDFLRVISREKDNQEYYLLKKRTTGSNSVTQQTMDNNTVDYDQSVHSR